MSTPRLLTTPRVVAGLVAAALGFAVYWLLSPTSCGDSAPPVCEREYGGPLEIAMALAVGCFVGLLTLSLLERHERHEHQD